MNGIYFCKLFLESTFTFTNWNLNLQLTFNTTWLQKYNSIITHPIAKSEKIHANA